MGAKKKAKRLTRRRRRYRPPTKAEIEKRIKETFQSHYRVLCYYGGFDRDRDDDIARLAKRQIVGSGMDLHTGLRDLEFDFGNRRASALRAAARIKSLRGVRVMIDSLERA